MNKELTEETEKGDQEVTTISAFWGVLEGLYGLIAVPAEWQWRMGEEFEAVMREGFLRARAGMEAGAFPCPVGCGCAHEVVKHGDGTIVAVCRCDSWNCDDFELNAEDLVLLELNWSKLGRAIAKALGFEAREANLGVHGLLQVGSFGGDGLPVVLCIQHDSEDMRAALAELGLRLQRPFALLAPTGRLMDAHCHALLASARARFFDLESRVAILPEGGLQASQSAAELFANLLPATARAVTVPEAARVPARRYAFEQNGRLWTVLFEGTSFPLENTLGARYLDYLLHHPNIPISAYDLEVVVQPEKGKARAKDSIQEKLDPQAAREYLRELNRLRAEQDAAREDGDQGEVDKLEVEIEALESALAGTNGSSDAGERARGNVRKAIGKVVRKLKKGGAPEKAFARHIETCVGTGFECSYNQEGRLWNE